MNKTNNTSTNSNSEIHTIAVLGAGAMGRGIAQVAAMGGFTTRLQDISGEVLEDALAVIQRNLAKGVDLGKVDEAAATRAQELLSTTTGMGEAASDADLIIEAVPEKIQLKIELFQALDEYAPAAAYFATNTSALSITELGAACGRPERFAGMHFFNPVHIMRLLELVRGLETSAETVAALRGVGEAMGKEVVVVADVPGFATTRINSLIGNEAFRMLESGVSSAEEIDQALKLGLNHPMGPFEMVDLVGLDVRMDILEHLHATLGERYRPTNLQRRYVKAGRLGRKTGRGIYEYDERGRRIRPAGER